MYPADPPQHGAVRVPPALARPGPVPPAAPVSAHGRIGPRGPVHAQVPPVSPRHGSAVVSRRAALGLLGGALGVALSGCGVRRDRAATGLPLIPPRAVDARATAAYVELRRVRLALAAARSAAGAAGPLSGIGTVLAGIHADQDQVLAGRLRELDEDPTDTARLDEAARASGTVLSPAPTPAATSASALPGAASTSSAGTTAATSAPASATPPSLAAAEAQGLAPADLASLPSLPRDELPLLLSLRVQRAVALPLVGGTAPEWVTPVVGDEAEAARLVGVFRAAEYGLGVAAARTQGPTRTRLTGPLGWVAAARLVLEPQAGDRPLPRPAAGYTLPAPVTDDASAVRLGGVLLGRLTDAILSGTPTVAGHSGGLVAILSLACVAESQAHDLGHPLRAFPGLAHG